MSFMNFLNIFGAYAVHTILPPPKIHLSPPPHIYNECQVLLSVFFSALYVCKILQRREFYAKTIFMKYEKTERQQSALGGGGGRGEEVGEGWRGGG
jgi:hypothetical protein